MTRLISVADVSSAPFILEGVIMLILGAVVIALIAGVVILIRKIVRKNNASQLSSGVTNELVNYVEQKEE